MKQFILWFVIGFVVTTIFVNKGYGATFVAPIEFTSKYMSQWNQLEDSIRNSKDKYNVIYWNGNGGSVSAANQFVSFLQQMKKDGKHIKLIITEVAISAHAYVVCNAESYTLSPDAQLIFHGVKGDLLGYTTYMDSMTRDVLKACVDRRIISQADVEYIIKYRARVHVSTIEPKKYYPDWSYEQYKQVPFIM